MEFALSQGARTAKLCMNVLSPELSFNFAGWRNTWQALSGRYEGCCVLPTLTTGKLSDIGYDGYSIEAQSERTKGEGRSTYSF